ncbi:MAG: electron transfer flavoprotein subunit alpha/FixB family protein, partial [Desulfobacula sp.]|nr:electron transfer flavoprotein subunit alpha/FixB family protein [Desulfobacula sp.]
FLAPDPFDMPDLELWLFYQGKKPDSIPDLTPLSPRVLLMAVDNPYLPESFLALIEQIYAQRPADLMVFSSDGLGAQLATRLAYRLNGSSCLKVQEYSIKSDKVDVSKQVYENNLSAKFSLSSKPYCLSVTKNACTPVQHMRLDPSMIIDPTTVNQLKNHWVKKCAITTDQPDKGLFNADIILAVGQGVKTQKNMDALEDIADTLNARLGASRPVVMNALTKMDRLIGASGLVLSPKLCIAAGVSGAGFFTVGIKNSELIVAINIDHNAPIFKVADVGIVGDMNTVLIELKKIIIAGKNKDHLQIDTGARGINL